MKRRSRSEPSGSTDPWDREGSHLRDAELPGRRTAWLLLLCCCVASQAQDGKDPLVKVWSEIRAKRWENAAQELAKMERTGNCKAAVCMAVHAHIADGAGNGPQAVEYARQATAVQDSGLSAAQYNSLGVLLYRRADGKRELLELAEKTFRHADSIYTGGASNIRFNLAKVLQKLGRNTEATEIMKKLEADGILIDPGMAILGDFTRPKASSLQPNAPPNRR